MNELRQWSQEGRFFSAVPERSHLSASDVLSLLRRYRAVVFIVFACCVGATYLTLSFLTDQYDTKASIIVKLGRENLDAPSDARNNVFSTGVRHEEVMSEIEMVKSPALLDQVVQELGPDTFKPHHVVPVGLIPRVKFYVKAVLRFGKTQYKNLLYAVGLQKKLDDREAAVDALSRDLSVTWQKETDVFEVTLRMPDPVLGRQILTQLLQDYLLRRIDVRKGSGLNEFMRKESNKLQGDLAQAETEEDTWKAQENVSSVKEELPLYLLRIRDLSAEHDQTIRDQQTAEKQRQDLLRLMRNMPENLRESQQDVPSPVAQTYRQHLTMLQSERAEMLTKYKESSVVVANKNDEIARVQSLLKNEQSTQTAAVTTVVNPVRQDIEKRLHEAEIAISGLSARSAAQISQLSQLQAQLQHFDLAANRLHDLERNRELLETRYLALAKRADDADVDVALDSDHISNVNIISPPWSDPEPAYPRKMLLMYVSLGVGLVLGVALALLLHYLDDEVRQVEDVRGILGVPCLGVVPASGPADLSL